MDAKDIKRKLDSESDKNVYIYNPLKTDFTWKYDGVDYIIPSRENKAFKTPLARHLGKHIVDAYLDTKDEGYSREKANKLVFPE